MKHAFKEYVFFIKTRSKISLTLNFHGISGLINDIWRRPEKLISQHMSPRDLYVCRGLSIVIICVSIEVLYVQNDVKSGAHMKKKCQKC